MHDDRHRYSRVASFRRVARTPGSLARQRVRARDRAEPADGLSRAGRRTSRRRLADGKTHRDSARTRRHRRTAPARFRARRPVCGGQAARVDRTSPPPVRTGACRGWNRTPEAHHRQDPHRAGNTVGGGAGAGLARMRGSPRLAGHRQIFRAAAAATRRRRKQCPRSAVPTGKGGSRTLPCLFADCARGRRWRAGGAYPETPRRAARSPCFAPCDGRRNNTNS